MAWETSGNGFGQRDIENEPEAWGRFTDEHLQAGDNRSEFIQKEKGHRNHHLYLWHLADTMGIFSNVLNIMSSEVAANSTNVATDCAQVQKSRKRASTDGKEEAKKARVEAKQEAFQIGVVASLSSISAAQVQELLGREENKLREFKLALLGRGLTSEQRELYGQLIEHHANKVAKFEEEVKQIRAGSNDLMLTFRNVN